MPCWCHMCSIIGAGAQRQHLLLLHRAHGRLYAGRREGVGRQQAVAGAVKPPVKERHAQEAMPSPNQMQFRNAVS